MSADTFIDDFAREAIQEFYDGTGATWDDIPLLESDLETFIENETKRAAEMIRLRLTDEGQRLITELKEERDTYA